MIKQTFLTFLTILFLIPQISNADDDDCISDPDLNNTDIVLMLDGSGSIETFANDIKDSAKGLLDELIDAGAGVSVAIGSFSNSATINAPLSTDYENLKDMIDAIVFPFGSTHVDSAITVSQTELLEEGTHDNKIIILLSDGVPDSTSRATTAATNAKALGIRIMTIGFNVSSNASAHIRARNFLAIAATDSDNDQDADGDGAINAVEREAENSDGDNFFIADDGASLDAAFERIAIIILTTWYADNDEDSYGDPTSTLSSCEQPDGYVADNTDCDDTNADISPIADEVCNGIDDNCNGTVDEGVLNACGACGEVPEEVCDAAEIDEDCDGLPNEGCECAIGEERPCGSSEGECEEGTQRCIDDGVWSDECEGEVVPTDEICDGLDNNCDGEVDEELLNACGTCGEAPEEVCDDGEDNDCDGEVDEGCTEERGEAVVEPPVMMVTGGGCACSLTNDHTIKSVHFIQFVLLMGFVTAIGVFRLKTPKKVVK